MKTKSWKIKTGQGVTIYVVIGIVKSNSLKYIVSSEGYSIVCLVFDIKQLKGMEWSGQIMNTSCADIHQMTGH